MNAPTAVRTADPPSPKSALVDYGVLRDLLGYRVRRAQLRITEAFDVEFGPSGLTTQRFSALELIARTPGLTQGRLAEAMGASAPQVSVVVDALLALDLVERRATERDRRLRTLFVTSSGRRRIGDLERRVIAHDERISAALSAEDRTALAELLARIASPLSAPSEPKDQ